MTRWPSYVSPGGERLLKLVLDVGEAWTASATNYWTVTVRLRSAGQDYGETIARRALDAVSIAPGSPLTLYDEPTGPLVLSDGTSIVASLDATGSPANLTNAAVRALIQPIVR